MKRRFVLSVTVLVVAFAGLLLGQSPKDSRPKPGFIRRRHGAIPTSKGYGRKRRRSDAAPANLGDRTTLTDEEFAQREAQAKRQAEADNQTSRPAIRRPGIGPPSYWTERGGQHVKHLSSSILQNGRLPALTAEAEKYRKEARGGKGLPGEWRGKRILRRSQYLLPMITRGLWVRLFLSSTTTEIRSFSRPGYVVSKRNDPRIRVIPLDGRPHVNPNIQAFMGDSRGHWEGNTLVVETTNFTDKVAIGSNGAGYPGDPGYHSEQLKVVERFTRVSDRQDRISGHRDRRKTWTRPWTISIELKRNDSTSSSSTPATKETTRWRISSVAPERPTEVSKRFIRGEEAMQTRLIAAVPIGSHSWLRFRLWLTTHSRRNSTKETGPSVRQGHQDGMDQSPRLDSHRRHRCRRQGHKLDGRMRQPEHHAATRLHKGIARIRIGNHC